MTNKATSIAASAHRAAKETLPYAAIILSILALWHTYRSDYLSSQLRLNAKLLEGFAICQQLLFQSQKLKFIRSVFRLNAPSYSAKLFKDGPAPEATEQLAKECSSQFIEGHGKLQFSLESETQHENTIARLKIRLEDTTRENETLESLIKLLKPEDLK